RKPIDMCLAGCILGWLPAAAWRPQFDVQRFRRMLRQSVPLSAALILNFTLMGIGSPLVNACFGLRGLGLYRAASDLAGKIAFVSNGVNRVVSPRASRYFSGHGASRELRHLLDAVLRCSSAAYLTFAAAMGFLGPALLRAIGLTEHTTTALF